MWIGEKKIKGTLALEGTDNVRVMFKDNTETEINKKLLKIIKSDKKSDGLITDVIAHILGTKFLMEMSEYGLDYDMVELIAQRMHTNAHNMREELFRRTFKCGGANSIALKTLIANYDEEVKEIEKRAS